MSVLQQQPNMSIGPVSADAVPELARKRKGQLRLIGERFSRNRAAVVGLIVLVVIAVAAILAPVLTHATATFDPATTPTSDILDTPSLQHPLGTDDLGRDVLARLLFGARVSLSVGVVSMLVALLLGVTIGSISGYYGGWLDSVIMRVVDGVLSVPYLIILFVLSVSFSDGSFLSIVLLIASFSWAEASRLVRGEFLAMKEREFLLAARTLGASDVRLMLMHILPNIAGPIIVAGTLLIGNNIISESVLSYFGFGLQVPFASWGTMLNDSREFFHSAPLLLWAPGLAILVTVLCVNLMGDGLRDALDPYMTER